MPPAWSAGAGHGHDGVLEVGAGGRRRHLDVTQPGVLAPVGAMLGGLVVAGTALSCPPRRPQMDCGWPTVSVASGPIGPLTGRHAGQLAGHGATA